MANCYCERAAWKMRGAPVTRVRVHCVLEMMRSRIVSRSADRPDTMFARTHPL